MRYNGNNKETKKAILKENQSYLMERLDKTSKLELVEIIERDNDRERQRYRNDEHYGNAVIVIKLDGIEVQRLEIKENDYFISIKNTFELFNNLKHMYIDLGTVDASLTFIDAYDSD